MNTLKKAAAWISVLMLLCSMTACQKKPVDSPSSAAQTASSTAGTNGPADTDPTQDTQDTGSETAADPTGTTGANGSQNTTKAPSQNTQATTKVQVWGSRPKGTTSAQPAVIDMKGATITYGTKWITDYGNGDPGDSTIGDKWIAWRKNFEKTFNCKLKNVYVSPYTLFSSLSTKLMAGDKVADVITMQLFDVEAFRHAGLLQELQKVPGLNMEHPLVSQSMVDNFTYNGKSYLFSYGLTYSEVNGVYVNLDMIKELKLDDPFELVRQKKWTWKALDKMCQAAYQDTNKNNKIDSADRFGISFGPDFALGTLRVSGLKVISYNNGQFSYTYNNAKTLSYLNAVKDTIKAGNRVREPAEDIYQKFVQKGLLFAVGQSGLQADPKHVLWDADFEMGYLPCPTHEEGMAYTNSCSTWLGGVSIPVNVNAESLRNVGYFLNAIMEMTNTLSSESKKELQRQMGKESYDLFMTYSNKFTVDAYCWQNEFKDLVKQKMDDTLFDNSVTPAKYLESIDTAMKNAVKDYYAKDPDLIS